MSQLINKIAIQDAYSDKYQHCWGCGPRNDGGLHLKSYPTEDGAGCVCQYVPEKSYTGGVPDKLSGGMIAMIFDCHGTASAAWFNHRSKGLKLGQDSEIQRYITARLEIDYMSPVSMDELIIVTSSLEELGERKAIVNLEMEAAGVVRAKAKLVAVRSKSS